MDLCNKILVPELSAVIKRGGVAVFPADTVYGLACDPESNEAVTRLCGLKRRPVSKPSAIMFFQKEPALEFVADLDGSIIEAVGGLIPGPVTLILPNPARLYPLACGEDSETIGLRVPALGGTLQLPADFAGPVLQSSANLSGGPEPSRLSDVPDEILENVDLAIDGGKLPGSPSTVIDLCRYGADGSYLVLREGALPIEEVDRALAGGN